MAFTPKTWVGRSVEHPGRINLLPTGIENQFDVERAEGEIYNDGDLVSDVSLNNLEQRIFDAFAGKADGTGGAANNALALGGIAAGNYVKNTPEVGSLTKINGWTGGTLETTAFGRIFEIRVAVSPINGTANTVVAMLPTGYYPSGLHNNAESPLMVRAEGEGFALEAKQATIPLGTYLVFVAR